ncbi:hypothetical protein FNL21_11175 [Staphylococcus chromogenes]|nr:hypothetical protein [Staphylococcus chromogenes]PTG88184.1 hypothetical protein BU645_11275 [Staphylococcus chromogenes]TRL26646.1 hypothetical protein FNL21_11175 [Staphylococcus chromogenes]
MNLSCKIFSFKIRLAKKTPKKIIIRAKAKV